jgi:hypothetical protein
MKPVAIVRTSNRLDLDYKNEASRFCRIQDGIIDIHSHLQGKLATSLYADAARHYGISKTYSMTALDEIPVVRSVLNDAVSFIAIPNFRSQDILRSFGSEFLDQLPEFKKQGARIAKFWNAPRIYEMTDTPFHKNPLRINSPIRRDAMKCAADLGMSFMAHIADPDTWFATKYNDATQYGTKREQYELFEEVLSEFNVPWIAAHMGGYPEDLDFLGGLLSRNDNLYLDCSATKWIVRELSKHPVQTVQDFFTTWEGRLLFGSDIVARESHLSSSSNNNEMDSKASSSTEAYDLYASRYWALRMLLETDYHGESPISDPDLHLVDSEKHSPTDAPTLRGAKLSDETLQKLYRQAAVNLGL